MAQRDPLQLVPCVTCATCDTGMRFDTSQGSAVHECTCQKQTGVERFVRTRHAHLAASAARAMRPSVTLCSWYLVSHVPHATLECALIHPNAVQCMSARAKSRLSSSALCEYDTLIRPRVSHALARCGTSRSVLSVPQECSCIATFLAAFPIVLRHRASVHIRSSCTSLAHPSRAQETESCHGS